MYFPTVHCREVPTLLTLELTKRCATSIKAEPYYAATLSFNGPLGITEGSFLNIAPKYPFKSCKGSNGSTEYLCSDISSRHTSGVNNKREGTL